MLFPRAVSQCAASKGPRTPISSPALVMPISSPALVMIIPASSERRSVKVGSLVAGGLPSRDVPDEADSPGTSLVVANLVAG